MVPFQLVREPKYRIFFHHEDTELMDRLEKMLKNHECVYSPSLGIASFLANVNFVDKMGGETKPLEELIGQEITTRSVAPIDAFDPYPTSNNHFVIDKFGRHLNAERKPDGFYRVIFDTNAVPMTGKILETDKTLHMDSKLTYFHEKTQQPVFVW